MESAAGARGAVHIEGDVVSRDVFAFVAPPGLVGMEDLPKDYRMPSLGSRDSVIGIIRRLAPQVDESDPAWLVIQGPDYLVEVSLGSEAELDSFMFFIRSGDNSVPLLVAIAGALGATLFDTSSGAFLTGLTGLPRLAEPPGN